MERDIAITGAQTRFPATRRSAVLAAASDDPGERQLGLETLIAAYWKPVYKYIRLHWSQPEDDAQDLTQAFFTRAIDKQYFKSFSVEKGTFRTFLRTCVDGFVSNEKRSASRLKRGGGSLTVSLDFEDAEGELRRQEIPDHTSPEVLFQREWARTLFAIALENFKNRCEAEGRSVQFRVFHRYDIENPADGRKTTYAEFASEFGVSPRDITNYLAAMRRGFRAAVLETLRSLTASEREFRSEAHWLLGVEL